MTRGTEYKSIRVYIVGITTARLIRFPSLSFIPVFRDISIFRRSLICSMRTTFASSAYFSERIVLLRSNNGRYTGGYLYAIPVRHLGILKTFSEQRCRKETRRNWKSLVNAAISLSILHHHRLNIAWKRQNIVRNKSQWAINRRDGAGTIVFTSHQLQMAVRHDAIFPIVLHRACTRNRDFRKSRYA